MINWVTQLSIKEKVKLFNKLYDELAGYGREGDTELAHVNPFEAKLLKAVGGSGTINPVTGLREYKGGGRSAPPPPATQTVRQEATIPEELKPFVTDILEESQAQYRQRQEEGYVPYEGAQIAQFTPEQEQAFQATRGIFEQGLAGTPLGQSTTYLAPALGATTASTLPTTAATIGQYMDPYLENVLRVQEQEARRADEISRQSRAAQAVQAGAFGGSREAVMEAEAQRGLEDRLASLRASGMSQAYQTAQQMAEAQRQRELQAGRQFAALGETAAQQQAREIGGLAATGEALRGQQQAALDIAKTQFMEEQQFPQSQLQQYSSIIRGFPLTPSQLQTTQTVTPQPSLTQQLLGAGIGAAGLAGAFGAFKKEGGLVGLAEGGRPMDAMPMAAMPMKPRRRAADLGAAIGDLAQRMGTGRSLSQTGSGLTSILSAPAISENMQQTPQPSAMPMQQMQNMQQMPQASATPMQMPSQRFMNAGGRVGYYQQGTGGGVIPPIGGGVSTIDLLQSYKEAVARGNERQIKRLGDELKKRQGVKPDRVLQDDPTGVRSQIGTGDMDVAKPTPPKDARALAGSTQADAGRGAFFGDVGGRTVAAVPAGTRATPAPAPAPVPSETPESSEDIASRRFTAIRDEIEQGQDLLRKRGEGIAEAFKQGTIDRTAYKKERSIIDAQSLDLLKNEKSLIQSRMNQSPEHQAFKERLAKLTDEKTRMNELKSDFDKQAFLDLARFGFGVASNVDWASEAGKAIENFAETKKEERTAKRDLAKEVTNAMALELDLSDKERGRLEGLQDKLLNADKNAVQIAADNLESLRGLNAEERQDRIASLSAQAGIDEKIINQNIDLLENLYDYQAALVEARAEGKDFVRVPTDVVEKIVKSEGISAKSSYDAADFENAFNAEISRELERYGAPASGRAVQIATELSQDENFMNRVRRRAEGFAAARTGGQRVTQEGGGVGTVAPVADASTKEILNSIREPQQ
jgi:hypothetical protein